MITKQDEKTVKIEVIYNRKDINLDTPGDSINVKTKNTFILEKLDNNCKSIRHMLQK